MDDVIASALKTISTQRRNIFMTYSFVGRVKSLVVIRTENADDLAATVECKFEVDDKLTVDGDKKSVVYEKVADSDDVKIIILPRKFNIMNKVIFDFISQHSKEKLKITYNENNVITSAELIYG